MPLGISPPQPQAFVPGTMNNRNSVKEEGVCNV